MIRLEQVVVKMAGEIEEAQATGDQARIKEHVRAVRLLADLILDQDQDQESEKVVPSEKSDISDQELLQMMGSKAKPKPKATGEYGQSTSDSLLDF